MEKRIITSTSKSSATCSDLILRGGGDADTTRLTFRPELVENPNNTTAAVRGTFIYQKKGHKDAWIDLRGSSLPELKKAKDTSWSLKQVRSLSCFDVWLSYTSCLRKTEFHLVKRSMSEQIQLWQI